MTATYDPRAVILDVLAALRRAGISAPMRTRNLSAANTAARDLLAALDVPASPPRPVPTRWRVAYRMTLVDTAAGVEVERALAADRTEVGRVAAEWRAVDGRSRIDIEPVQAALPDQGGLAA